MKKLIKLLVLPLLVLTCCVVMTACGGKGKGGDDTNITDLPDGTVEEITLEPELKKAMANSKDALTGLKYRTELEYTHILVNNGTTVGYESKLNQITENWTDGTFYRISMEDNGDINYADKFAATEFEVLSQAVINNFTGYTENNEYSFVTFLDKANKNFDMASSWTKSRNTFTAPLSIDNGPSNRHARFTVENERISKLEIVIISVTSSGDEETVVSTLELLFTAAPFEITKPALPNGTEWTERYRITVNFIDSIGKPADIAPLTMPGQYNADIYRIKDAVEIRITILNVAGECYKSDMELFTGNFILTEDTTLYYEVRPVAADKQDEITALDNLYTLIDSQVSNYEVTVKNNNSLIAVYGLMYNSNQNVALDYYYVKCSDNTEMWFISVLDTNDDINYELYTKAPSGEVTYVTEYTGDPQTDFEDTYYSIEGYYPFDIPALILNHTGDAIEKIQYGNTFPDAFTFDTEKVLTFNYPSFGVIGINYGDSQMPPFPEIPTNIN